MKTDNKRKAPAFQFYADDFTAGTADMSAEEVGAYIRLLCHQWTKGGVPNDEDRAGRIAGLMGSPSLGYVLAKFSLCTDGMLRNDRLEKVRADQAEFKAKQSKSGKSGAEKRWGIGKNDGDPNGDPNGSAIATPMATPMAKRWPEDGSPSPSPIIDLNLGLSPKRDSGQKPKRFCPPSLEEIKIGCQLIGLTDDDAEMFMNHYESNGWKVGKVKMVKWEAALKNWKIRNTPKGFSNQNQRQLIGTSTPDDAEF